MARLLPADLAAIFVGVKPGTLRAWRHRGYLTPAGGTERRPLYSIVDLHEAKKATARGARKTAQKVAT